MPIRLTIFFFKESQVKKKKYGNVILHFALQCGLFCKVDVLNYLLHNKSDPYVSYGFYESWHTSTLTCGKLLAVPSLVKPFKFLSVQMWPLS